MYEIEANVSISECAAAWQQSMDRTKMEPGGKVVIKKYGNRRLYDTAASRYVNLDEVAGFIRQGQDVQVVDAKTGKDLTRVVLTQIITDDARDKPTGLPLELLRQLVVASDEVRREFVMWYLKSAFDAYQKVQSAVQTSVGNVQSAILSPVEMMRSFLSSPPGPAPRAETGSELEALRKKVAELEARVQKPERKKSRRKARRGTS
jgi:polyhydroxyalkanoate synthesis repressor PhaR